MRPRWDIKSSASLPFFLKYKTVCKELLEDLKAAGVVEDNFTMSALRCKVSREGGIPKRPDQEENTETTGAGEKKREESSSEEKKPDGTPVQRKERLSKLYEKLARSPRKKASSTHGKNREE